MRLFFEVGIIFIGIILGIEAFYPYSILNKNIIYSILNSNFFSALIVLIVGVFAIGLYIRQRREYKRDAAKLIIQEIRYAELQIRIARRINNVYHFDSRLLPTNSWYNNIHLFIKDLKETEIDLISQFYSAAVYLDTLISKYSEIKCQEYDVVKFQFPFSSNSVTIPLDIPDQSLSVPNPTLEPNQNLTPPIKQNEIFLEYKIKGNRSETNKILIEVSEKIEFLYNSPVMDKLREISEKKWYQIL